MFRGYRVEIMRVDSLSKCYLLWCCGMAMLSVRIVGVDASMIGDSYD